MIFLTVCKNKQTSAFSFIYCCCHLRSKVRVICPTYPRNKTIYFLILQYVDSCSLYYSSYNSEYITSVLFWVIFIVAAKQPKKKHEKKVLPKKITMWLIRNWYYMTARIKALGSKWATLLNICCLLIICVSLSKLWHQLSGFWSNSWKFL